MTAPVVITLGTPGFQSAASEAGMSLKRQMRRPAKAWTGISAATEGSESIAGTDEAVVVVVVAWYVLREPKDKLAMAPELSPVDAAGAAGTNWRGR
jgi:hypothetical protein